MMVSAWKLAARWVGALVFAVALASCDASPANASKGGHKLYIAAAASLKQPLTELIDEFKRLHPDVEVNPTYGASGTLYAQVVSKAPFDLFLSADVDYPWKLADAGLTADGRVHAFATGRLVLFVNKHVGLEPRDLEVLKHERIKKVAIASPRTAPYGRAAEAAMKATGVYEQVKDKLVIGESVEQAIGFVRTGAAEVAILPRSIATRPPLSDTGVFAEIPGSLYSPILHGGVIVKAAANVENAKVFVAFLTGEVGQKVLKGYGLAAAE